LVKSVEPPIDTTPLPPKPGALKFGWLRTLKNSALNCAEKRSLNLKLLKVEKSRLWNPGVTVWPGLSPRIALPVNGMHPGAVLGSAPNGHPCWKAAALPNQYGRFVPPL